MIDRDPARALIQRTAALVAGGRARPTVARPRYSGFAMFSETGSASWHWGDLPARELARHGTYIDVLHLDQALDRQRLIVPPGRILVDYSIGWKLDPAELRGYGARILYVVDDFLARPTPWCPLPDLAEFVKLLEPKLRASDGIVCPTARLAEWLQKYDVPVSVIPIALPRLDELPRPGARPHEGIRVGWCGSFTHAGDLEVIAPAVLELLAHRDDVTVVIAGECFPSWTANHPRIECHQAAVYMPAYFTWLASLDLDVFLVPLASGQPFNEAKPALKPLEAAGLGLPVIASRVGSYATELVHEASALLCENTTPSWSAALTRLVNDADLRAHLAEGGRAWASQNTIEETAPLWEKLWLT